MAKKKSSAKKASVKKSNTKNKSVKKTVKKVVKKSTPKTKAAKPAPKKTAKPVAKKKATKPAAKKVVKKAVKTAKVAKVKKATKPTKAAKATKAKPVKKAKAPTKAAKPAVSASVNQHLMKAEPPKKALVDLSEFVTPLDDRLIVQTSGTDKMTAGGLYIPDTVADISGNLHGTVVAVGRGHVSPKGHLRPMDVQVGDKVVFSSYAGSKVNLKNEELVILRESEVMGVVSK